MCFLLDAGRPNLIWNQTKLWTKKNNFKLRQTTISFYKQKTTALCTAEHLPLLSENRNDWGICVLGDGPRNDEGIRQGTMKELGYWGAVATAKSPSGTLVAAELPEQQTCGITWWPCPHQSHSHMPPPTTVPCLLDGSCQYHIWATTYFCLVGIN